MSSADLQKCDWGEIEETLAKANSKVKFCLTGYHWQNGLAEKRVHKLKQCLKLLTLEKNPSLQLKLIMDLTEQVCGYDE